MKKIIAALLIMASFLLGVGSCSSLVIDHAMSAIDGNDLTMVMGGFGQTANKGYLFAQLREGQDGSGRVSLFFPSVKCKRDACVEYQFFNRDSSFGPKGSLLSGQTNTSLALSEIVGHTAPITRADEGEFYVIAVVYLLADDGIEYSTVMRGFLRLNVLKPDYRVLSCNDPAKGWNLQFNKDCYASYSTAGRSAVCGVCK